MPARSKIRAGGSRRLVGTTSDPRFVPPQFVSPANRAENGRRPNGDLGGVGPEDVVGDRHGTSVPGATMPSPRRLAQVDRQRIPGKPLDADVQG